MEIKMRAGAVNAPITDKTAKLFSKKLLTNTINYVIMNTTNKERGYQL